MDLLVWDLRGEWIQYKVYFSILDVPVLVHIFPLNLREVNYLVCDNICYRRRLTYPNLYISKLLKIHETLGGLLYFKGKIRTEKSWSLLPAYNTKILPWCLDAPKPSFEDLIIVFVVLG